MKNLKIPYVVIESIPVYTVFGTLGLVSFIGFKIYSSIKSKDKTPKKD